MTSWILSASAGLALALVAGSAIAAAEGDAWGGGRLIKVQHHRDTVHPGPKEYKPPCEPPHFKAGQPARNSHVASFSEFSAWVSHSADPDRITVHINGKPISPTIKKKLDSSFAVSGKVEPITQPGPVVILVLAYDKTGECKDQLAYRVMVGGEAKAGEAKVPEAAAAPAKP
jgi:hypothetical protein